MSWIEQSVKVILRRKGVDYLPRLVKASFLGQEHLVRNGVVDDGDYDDAWILALALHAKNIFDVGSNIGQSAFNMLHAPNVENVVLVDPSPLALTIAADTLIRNQMGHRAKFVNAFVCDVSDETVYFTGGYSTGGHRVDGTSENGPNVTVPAITVDGIVDKLSISPDFVKFDVQGLEGKIMAGSTGLAAKRQTRFLIEMHRTADRPQEKTTSEVLDWCDSNRYAAWYLSEGVRVWSTELVKHRGRYHLLLQPEDWDYPVWLSKITQGASVEAALEAVECCRAVRAL